MLFAQNNDPSLGYDWLLPICHPKAVDQRPLVYAFSALDITKARNPTNNNAAMTSATTNPNTLDGAMPTKVFVRLLATATAGLLKKVDDVNQ